MKPNGKNTIKLNSQSSLQKKVGKKKKSQRKIRVGGSVNSTKETTAHSKVSIREAQLKRNQAQFH